MLRGSVADAIMHSGKMSMLVLKPDDVAAKKSTLDVGENLAAAAALAMTASTSNETNCKGLISLA
jgi:hypothetical protein